MHKCRYHCRQLSPVEVFAHLRAQEAVPLSVFVVLDLITVGVHNAEEQQRDTETVERTEHAGKNEEILVADRQFSCSVLAPIALSSRQTATVRMLENLVVDG